MKRFLSILGLLLMAQVVFAKPQQYDQWATTNKQPEISATFTNSVIALVNAYSASPTNGVTSQQVSNLVEGGTLNFVGNSFAGDGNGLTNIATRSTNNQFITINGWSDRMEAYTNDQTVDTVEQIIFENAAPTFTGVLGGNGAGVTNVRANAIDGRLGGMYLYATNGDPLTIIGAATGNPNDPVYYFRWLSGNPSVSFNGSLNQSPGTNWIGISTWYANMYNMSKDVPFGMIVDGPGSAVMGLPRDNGYSISSRYPHGAIGFDLLNEGTFFINHPFTNYTYPHLLLSVADENGHTNVQWGVRGDKTNMIMGRSVDGINVQPTLAVNSNEWAWAKMLKIAVDPFRLSQARPVAPLEVFSDELPSSYDADVRIAVSGNGVVSRTNSALDLLVWPSESNTAIKTRVASKTDGSSVYHAQFIQQNIGTTPDRIFDISSAGLLTFPDPTSPTFSVTSAGAVTGAGVFSSGTAATQSTNLIRKAELDIVTNYIIGLIGTGGGITNLPSYLLTNNQTSPVTLKTNLTVQGTNEMQWARLTTMPSTAAVGMVGVDASGNLVTNAIPTAGALAIQTNGVALGIKTNLNFSQGDGITIDATSAGASNTIALATKLAGAGCIVLYTNSGQITISNSCPDVYLPIVVVTNCTIGIQDNGLGTSATNTLLVWVSTNQTCLGLSITNGRYQWGGAGYSNTQSAQLLIEDVGGFKRIDAGIGCFQTFWTNTSYWGSNWIIGASGSGPTPFTTTTNWQYTTNCTVSIITTNLQVIGTMNADDLRAPSLTISNAIVLTNTTTHDTTIITATNISSPSFVGNGAGLTNNSFATNADQFVTLAQLEANVSGSEVFYATTNKAGGFTLTGTTYGTNYASADIPPQATNSISSPAAGNYLRAYLTTNVFTSVASGILEVEFYGYRTGGTAPTVTFEAYIVNDVSKQIEYEFTNASAGQVIGTSLDHYTFSIPITDYTSTTNFRVMVRGKLLSGAPATVFTVVGGSYPTHFSFTIPGSSYLLKTGGTITGDLTVNGSLTASNLTLETLTTGTLTVTTNLTGSNATFTGTVTANTVSAATVNGTTFNLGTLILTNPPAINGSGITNLQITSDSYGVVYPTSTTTNFVMGTNFFKGDSVINATNVIVIQHFTNWPFADLNFTVKSPTNYYFFFPTNCHFYNTNGFIRVGSYWYASVPSNIWVIGSVRNTGSTSADTVAAVALEQQ